MLVPGRCLLEGKTYTNKFLLHSGKRPRRLVDMGRLTTIRAEFFHKRLTSAHRLL